MPNLTKFRYYLLYLHFKSLLITVMRADSFFAFLGGALVGAAVALLLAPEKGEVTRKKIIEKTEKPIEDLKEMTKKAAHKVSKKTAQKVDEVEKAVHKAGKKVRKSAKKAEEVVDAK